MTSTWTCRRCGPDTPIEVSVAGEGKVVVEGVQKTLQLSSRATSRRLLITSRISRMDSWPRYGLELEAFFKALQDGQLPTPGARSTLKTLRLCDRGGSQLARKAFGQAWRSLHRRHYRPALTSRTRIDVTPETAW